MVEDPRMGNSGLVEPRGAVLLNDKFDNELSNWHHEGIGHLDIVKWDDEQNAMRLDCTGSKQGGRGCHAFCTIDFPDNIAVEYDLLVRKSNGLVITFVAMKGLNDEDMITDLPPREGFFDDYVGWDAKTKSYHVSVSRYDDEGVHTGVSNWRKNPGLQLMWQGPDLCKEIGKRYAIRIVKDGAHLQLGVDGVLAHEFTDSDPRAELFPDSGKIGFRAIGSEVIAEIGHFRVRKLI